MEGKAVGAGLEGSGAGLGAGASFGRKEGRLGADLAGAAGAGAAAAGLTGAKPVPLLVAGLAAAGRPRPCSRGGQRGEERRG